MAERSNEVVIGRRVPATRDRVGVGLAVLYAGRWPAPGRGGVARLALGGNRCRRDRVGKYPMPNGRLSRPRGAVVTGRRAPTRSARAFGSAALRSSAGAGCSSVVEWRDHGSGAALLFPSVRSVPTRATASSNTAWTPGARLSTQGEAGAGHDVPVGV